MSTHPARPPHEGRRPAHRVGAGPLLLLGCGWLAFVGLAAGSGAAMVVALVAAAVLWPTAHRVDQQVRERHRRAGRPTALRRPLHAGLAAHTQKLTAPIGGTVGRVRGRARLLFVEADSEVITVDGLLEPVGAGDESARVPFWLRLRRPGPEWMSASMLSVVHTWADEGRSVEVETRPSGTGFQATLAAGNSRLVLELEDMGGLADAA